MTQMNLFRKQKQTHRHREQTCGWQGGVGGREMDWELGVNRCKLLCMKWMGNKVLLYSTLYIIPCPVMNHNGKEYKKECVYIYIYIHIHMTESLCCAAEINTTL